MQKTIYSITAQKRYAVPVLKEIMLGGTRSLCEQSAFGTEDVIEVEEDWN